MKNKIDITTDAIHDIRNSLNAIIGFSQILKRMIEDGDNSDKLLLYLNNIEESGSKINSIIIKELQSEKSKNIQINHEVETNDNTLKQIDETTYKEMKLLLNGLNKYAIYETEKLIDVVLQIEILLSKNKIQTNLVNKIHSLKKYILDADKKNVNLVVKEILKVVYY
jgi:signal transduction histidine kinase